MAYLAYKYFKKRREEKQQQLSQLSEDPSHPTEPSTATPTDRATLLTGDGKPRKKQKECVHRRDASQNSDGGIELASFPGQQPDNNEKQPMVDTSPCVLCKADKHNQRVYRWKVIGGLFVPFLVQSLDITIIAGALPFIASDFSIPTSFPQPSIFFGHATSNIPQTNSRSSTGSSRPST